MASMTTPNLPELKRLNMWVQEQDQLEPGARIWHQGNWVTLREETPMCHTAYCVAGMAAVRAGHKLYSQKTGEVFFDVEMDEMILDGREIGDEDIFNLGAELLGIDERTAGWLFNGDNSAATIDSVVRSVFRAAGADYDTVEPAPDLEIEIKAAEAARPQLLPPLNTPVNA